MGAEEILGSGLADPAIARLVACTTIREAASYDARFPEGRWGDITLVLRDGRRLQSGEINARGGPDAPLGRDAVTAKFRDFAVPVLGNPRADAIEAAVYGLRDGDSGLSPLQDLVLAGI